MGLSILTNTNALEAKNTLNKNTRLQTNFLTQLSTGLKINKGSDDPAGLIAMLRLASEISASESATYNAERANAVMNVADAGLQNVGSKLADAKALAIQCANTGAMSDAEIAACQMQLDSILGSIDRFAETTSFNGEKLLNGEQAIETTNVDSTALQDVQIDSYNSTADQDINVEVTAAATQAQATLVSGMGADTLTENLDLEISGSTGTTSITIASGSTAQDVVDAINAVSDQTGIEASVNGGDVELTSTEYGTSETLNANVLTGGTISGGQTVSNIDQATGTDAEVLINGQTASVDGKKISFSSGTTAGSFTLTDAFNSATGTSTFTVRSGTGMTFALTSDVSDSETIGLGSFHTSSLGGSNSGGYLNDVSSGGSASLANDPMAAVSIIDEAIMDIATSRGRIGAFQKNTIEPAIAQNQAQEIELSEAKSVIGDTDFATAVSDLIRQDILTTSGTNLLNMINQQQASILNLIG